MTNSSSFFSNRACAYFPCHAVDDPDSFNCLFCYCPLYMLGERCGGNFRYTAKGIKDCSACTVPHRPDAAGVIGRRFAEIAQAAGIKPSLIEKTEPETAAPDRSLLAEWQAALTPPDAAAMERARAKWDAVAKPLHGLGKLEDAVVKLAGLRGSERVTLEKRALAVLCADHGIVAQGVTQTDASVTATMAARIAERRSSACLIAKSVRADVFPVDLGMLRRVPGVRDLHVADGTADMSEGPAMTETQALTALRHGVTLARELAKAGYQILLTGEMGIGNTSAASALTAALLGLPVEQTVGRGAGLSDAGLARKRSAIERAIAVNRPDPADALDVLAKLGGFELAGLAGLCIGAALCRVPVALDGFPSAAAALVAERLVPGCVHAMLASHCSAEPAARAILDALGLDAPIHAGMKLGEGAGALCLLPLLDAALAVYDGAVGFAEAGVEQYVPQAEVVEPLCQPDDKSCRGGSPEPPVSPVTAGRRAAEGGGPYVLNPQDGEQTAIAHPEGGGMLILVTGGSACGKSSYAEAICMQKPGPRFYLASMRPNGEEGRERVARHRRLRMGKGFETVERYTDYASLRLPARGTVLLEDIGNLCANETFCADGTVRDPVKAVLDGIDTLTVQCELLVAVTNETGADGISYDEETTAYIRALGRVNAALAARADVVVELVAGLPICWKGTLPL
ncbi:MAG: nicotinate-nucleotide--dimethylbenzimidazole phosphoribosyltransferase [Oscillospiraceae bacterium]|nr:nicotinate-nucleotide--dimethylbenzimidazole phosphoribosyltransferase [Oscillospiraceae bacterium]